MKEDFLACLTGEIKDEVMERYVNARRVIELQIEHLYNQAEEVHGCAGEAAKRLARLGYWMLTDSMRLKLIDALHIPSPSPWRQYLQEGLPYEAHSIAVSAFRDRTKLRKIVFKSYERVYQRMDRYRRVREDLDAEREAVRTNISEFQNNAELMTVLSFLKALDTCAVEKSHFLGGNFTAEELVSVDERLRFRAPTMEALEPLLPLPLPEPSRMEHILRQLADSVFDHYRGDAKRLMELWGKQGY